MLDIMDGEEIFVPDSQAEETENAAPAEGGERPPLSDISNLPSKTGRGILPTATLKRPTTLEDIRTSVGALFDDPIVLDSQPPPSDDEDIDMGHPLSRTDTSASVDSAASRPGIVNRLLRASADAEQSAGGPMAFQANGAAANAPAFKIPRLLRRTTNLSTASSSSRASSSSGGSRPGGVRVGGSKKSNMHYQAYEAERKKAVDEAERKRKAQLKKTVMATKGRGIMGLLRTKESGFE
jgi:mediator of replication checkpoint protein 1